MAMREEFKTVGSWLFRWRSYLPLLLLVLVIATLLSAPVDIDELARDDETIDLWAAEFVGLLISLFGLSVRALTVGYAARRTSGRNTRGQIADSLNTTGMYSVVRHPLYFGNFIIWMGLSLPLESWQFSLMVALIFVLYYERICYCEEEFLRQRFGPQFFDWAARTPAFIPRIRAWRPPALPFSLRKVVAKEYTGLFAIFVAFTGIELLDTGLGDHAWEVDRAWAVLFIFNLGLYVMIRMVKRRTTLLDVPDR